MKKIVKQTVGVIMLFAVLTGLYILTAQEYGVFEALKGWLIAIGLAGLMVVGMYLVAENWR